MSPSDVVPTEDWSWPPHLDALAAAPAYHALLFENDRVRVLDTRIPPGHTVPLHTHQWPSVLYVLSASDFVRRDADGRVLVDSRTASNAAAAAVALWSAPLPPHTLENVGDREIRVISVELKD